MTAASALQVNGFAAGYSTTGDKDRQSAVSNFFDIITGSHSYATGGNNDGEYWQQPYQLGSTIAGVHNSLFYLIRRFLCFREVNSDFLSTLYLHAFQVESPQGLGKASSLLNNAKPDQGLCEDMHITIIPGDLHRDTWSFNILQYLTSIAVQDGAGRNTEETCTTYNMMKIARYLFQWTGNARYADYYERAILNGMLGVQRMPANYTSKGTQTVSAGSVVISR